MPTAQDLFVCMFGESLEDRQEISLDLEKQNDFFLSRREDYSILRDLSFEFRGRVPECIEWKETLNALILNGFIYPSRRQHYRLNKELFGYSYQQRVTRFSEQERVQISRLRQEFYSIFGVN